MTLDDLIPLLANMAVSHGGDSEVVLLPTGSIAARKVTAVHAIAGKDDKKIIALDAE